MIVKVTLFGRLRERLAKGSRGRIDLDLPEGSPIAEALAGLGIETAVLCSLNGKIERDFSRVLEDGDELYVFHPVGGGAAWAPPRLPLSINSKT